MMYYGLLLFFSSLICPLSMMFIFSLLLVFYSTSLYMYQGQVFTTLFNEVVLLDQFGTMLVLMTWILTLGCLLAIMMTFVENNILYFLMVFISSCSIMVYSSCSLFEFYLNFEITLFPIFMMILGWGYQPERFSASMALLMYTILGSLPLFVYISVFNNYGSGFFWEMLDSYNHGFLDICFYLTMMAFLVKLPMFLVHMWLPKAHVEAPVYGSMFLAGTLLKLGGIGLVRFLMFLKTPLAHKFLMVSLISLVYVGSICLFAGDMKIIIAYSSVAHMALALIMFFMMTETSIWAGFMILLTHGFSSSLMFLMAYIMYLRSLTRSVIINQNSLLWSSFFSLFWFISCVGMMGGPPASTLISEVLGILSMMSWWKISMFFLIIGALMGGGYSILLYSRTYHNFSNSMMSVKTSLSTFELLISFFHVFWLIVYFFLFHWVMVYK